MFQRSNKPRVLVGYFTYDISNDSSTNRERQRHRNYFALLNDTRICPLAWLLYHNHPPYIDLDHCQLIYTFVSGTDDRKLPTEQLNNDTILVNHEEGLNRTKDGSVNFDVTVLNIRENMNEGKTPTWFHYASQISNQFDLDYVMKTDSDTLIVMDQFLDFINDYLPPHGKRVYVGVLADKAFWDRTRYGDNPSTVDFLRKASKVQVYAKGELYILSKDLAEWVASRSLLTGRWRPWVERIEDHDLGLWVFQYPEPIVYIRIQPHQKFWIHPAKHYTIWNLFMNRESRKLNGTDLYPEPPQLGPHQKEMLRVYQKQKRYFESINVTLV
jgi:Galactosyltransferase